METENQTIDWLREIGFEVELVEEDHPDAFVKGVWLDHGKIMVCRGIAHFGDILHEAGHLACIPSLFRDLVRPGSVPGPLLQEALHEYLEEHPMMNAQGREDPVYRSIMQMGDCEATAWAYAASKLLGHSTALLFDDRPPDDQPYDGKGPDIWLSLSMNAHFGINGLRAAGFCEVKTFPKMHHWLAP